jgi:REP element-mobilizing transposase RayT
MPRAPRLQFPNACYHVINRGNYRSDIFIDRRTATAFERCLFETCQRMGWILHAHVVMRNHFHLAIRTPRANLSQGMHWLETTFATRFNRLRGARGHLFQGRFHALLVEPGISLVRVVNYIHLNPVRAKIVTAEQLSAYRCGSFRYFSQKLRPAFLQRSEWLQTLGCSDDAAGWRAYRSHLSWLSTDPREQERQAWGKLSAGWAIGGAAWHKQLKVSCRHTLGRHLLSSSENAALDQEDWTSALSALLHQSGRTLAQAQAEPKSSPWKIKLASILRRTTSATIPWIAQSLHLGSPSSLRVYLARLRHSTQQQ